MNNTPDQDLIARDLRHLWHPCTQMKDHEAYPPIPIARAEGSYLYTAEGRPIIDAVSSWWCKSLGHGHPALRAAAAKQAEAFEHVILAGTTNEGIVRLCERLATICAPLDRAFFADNGSTGVEVAVKMALQAQAQHGAPERVKLASLKNGYHGETLLTMGVSDCDLYSGPFAKFLPECLRLGPLPYRTGPSDDQWNMVTDDEWAVVEAQLEPIADELAAIVFEPIVQGAGGFCMYSPDFLRKLRAWADAHGVYLVADEIMTGLGRTGRALACQHAGIMPDFAILSKGLTAGWVPMSVVMTSSETFDLFYADYASGRAFLHSNTYAGNALATAIANAALTVYEEADTFARVAEESAALLSRMRKVAETTGALRNVRGVGFVVAADLVNPDTGKPYPSEDRTGWHVYHEAVKQGAWLRPLGDTLYWLPPLNTPNIVLDDLADVTTTAIQATLN